MTNEEFERRMDFLLNQQAVFDSGMQQLRESHARLEAAHAQTQDLLTRSVNVMFAGFNEVNAKINVLVDRQIKLTEAQTLTDGVVRNLSAKVDALVDSQIRTEQNLRNLSDVVDRHIREGRNGGTKQ